MNHNYTLSVLVHKGILDLEEAKHLAVELAKTIHSQDFVTAHKTVEKILTDFEKKTPLKTL